jgi:hypothetical protein
MDGDSVDRVIKGLRNMVESHGLWQVRVGRRMVTEAGMVDEDK